MMVSTTEYQPEDPDIQNLSAIDRLILKRNSEAYSSDDMQVQLLITIYFKNMFDLLVF